MSLVDIWVVDLRWYLLNEKNGVPIRREVGKVVRRVKQIKLYLVFGVMNL